MSFHLNRRIFLSTLIGLMLGLSGCSSIQVSQDYQTNANFESIKTLQWLDEADQVEPKASTFAAKNPLIATRITQAITQQLRLKKIDVVTENPTGFVTYHVETLAKPRSSQVTTSFGFGSYGRYGGFGFQTHPDSDFYDEGKLVIDIFNAKKQLIWRGISTRYVEEHIAPEEQTKIIQEVVSKLLEQYPPTTASP